MLEDKRLNNEKIKVLLVDDHAMLRKGMALLLDSEDDIEIIGEASDGADAIEQVRSLKPDIVVMDISMPKLNGIEATKQIVTGSPRSKIIALSIHSAKSFVDDMLSAGASGYLLKESVPEELLLGIRAVMHGDMYLSSAITGKVVSAYVEGISDELDHDLANVETSILQTKLQRPPVTPDLIARPRLFEQLDTERVRPLTLVSAPAGYGKTTLISGWLNTCDWPSAWLTLAESENDLRQFLRYFIAAIESICPDSCEKTRNLASANELPPIPTLTASLSNELEALDMPFILALDDYQLINAQSPVNDLLQELLSIPPLPLHLVIITRRDPPLNLITLRANNQLTVKRMQDLAFTLPEVRTLVEKTTNFTLTDQAIVNLQDKMEGWIVGLRLVLEALRHHKNPNEYLCKMQSDFQHTQEYLFQEVISQQPPRIQNCLLKSSIFERISPSLCTALYESKSSCMKTELDDDGFIDEIINNNLFVTPLDPKNQWFRYQHFFKHLLQREMKKRFTSEEINKLHLKASAWFESEGLIDEALHHAFASENIELAAEIVERHARSLINEGKKWYLVRKWLSQLPAEVINRRPELLWAQAWVLYRELNINKLQEIIDRMDDLIGNDAESQSLSGDVALFSGLCAFLNSDSTRGLKYIEKALDMEESEHNQIRLVLAELLLGLVGQMDGQEERVRNALTRRLNDSSLLNPIREINLVQTLVTLSYLSANPSKSGPLLHRGRKVAQLSGHRTLNRASDYLDGLTYLQWGELEKAISYLEDAVNGKYFHDIRGALDAMCALVLAYQMHGQPARADKTLQSLYKHIHNSYLSNNSLADSCAARLALMQGRPEAAIQWMRRNTLPSTEVMIFWFEVPCVTYCRVLIAEGSTTSLQQAEKQLAEYAEMNEAHHNSYQLIGILTLQAVAYDRLKRRDEALDMLEKALSLAQPGGFIFAFLELGQPMAKLLKSYAEQKRGLTTFVRSLLDAMGTPQIQPEPKSAWTGEPLTNRELDILKLLTQRLQNKEIAAKLFVSSETVKSHLKHLYQKLNVHNRREATEKASSILSTNTYISPKDS